jgi:F-box protein 21
MPIRQKALSLVRWLRAKNLTGTEDPELNYRNIRNCFIGHALSDPQHPSLPIISSAIFCAVADRLDMKTSCCAFPSHVHASVFAPPGQSLDGTTSEPGVEMEAMYLDPYGSDEEITVEDLRLRLVEFGWASGSDVFLSASPVPVIVQRTAQNIKTTYARAQELRDGDQSGVELKRLRTGHPEMNLEAAFYGSMWAQLLTKQISNIHWNVNLNSFLNRFALTWSEDAWIVEKYLVPLYDTFIESRPQPRNLVGWENVREILAMLRNLDHRQPTISRRYTQDIHNKVHHKIGDVFRHKRYGYVGVINGWAATGTTALPTPHYMTADETEEEEEGDGVNNGNDNGGEGGNPLELPSIRSRTYYTCL